MDSQNQEWLDKIRQQFNYAPYPEIPLEVCPREDGVILFFHNLVTPYYLHYQQVVDPQNTVILDAGCGSGFKSLLLALANPGARIVGIDLSAESIELAHLRLKQNGLDQAEFHVLSLEQLPSLGLQFDYINCDEMLYLLPDPTAGLAVMKSVLSPTGIIRANLHNYSQREGFYQAQKLFRLMGLMESNPEAFEVNIVIETMKALKEGIWLKHRAWSKKFDTESNDPDAARQEILMNHLFQEDKGFTIPQLFAMLQATGLEFIKMVNWNHWRIVDLFKSPDQIPAIWWETLVQASVAEQLHMYNLLHPIHRLLDFWCGHPKAPEVPVSQWDEAAWKTCQVHLHPQLQRAVVRDAVKTCATAFHSFDISLPIDPKLPKPVILDSTLASLLLPLWDAPQPVQALVTRYLNVRSLDPATLDPISEVRAFAEIKQLLIRLEAYCYVLLVVCQSKNYG